VIHDNPFAPDLAPEFILETLGLTEALRRLDEARGAREPFLLVTADPGMGKTVLADLVIARWGARVHPMHLTLPLRTGDELLEEILHRLGSEAPEGANRPKLVARFEAALGEIAAREQIALIVVDDAHHVPIELFEELRLLVSAARQARRPLEVMLVGPPALAARLDDPSLAALKQRVSVRIQLEPLSGGETRRYIRHRLAIGGEDGSKLFSRKTCAEIAAHTHGVPRQINTLAGEALRLARLAKSATVEPDHVRNAVAALTGVLPKPLAEDTSDEPAEVAPVPAAPRPMVTAKTAAAPAPAPTAASVPPAALAPSVASTPPPAPPKAEPKPESRPAPAPAPKPAPVASEPAEFVDGCSKPTPAPPANYTPSEWVARFVGDKGPLDWGSLKPARETKAPEPPVAEAPASAENAAPAEAPAEAAPAEAATAAAPRARKAPKAPARPARRKRIALRMPATAALGALFVAGVIALLFRASGLAHRKGALADSTATASVTPTSDEKPSRTTTGKVSGRAASESAPESSPAIPKGPYTIEVGGLLDYQAALDERSRIVSLTGIEGWVAPGGGDHSDKYRIVLGKFSAYSRAQGAANMLERSKTLPRATVVKLPPSRVRQ
jgi:type II secretory pathway predicted ATPase ExeA